MGLSLGGELALVLAALFKQTRAVGGYYPSHMIFGDFVVDEKRKGLKAESHEIRT